MKLIYQLVKPFLVSLRAGARTPADVALEIGLSEEDVIGAIAAYQSVDSSKKANKTPKTPKTGLIPDNSGKNDQNESTFDLKGTKRHKNLTLEAFLPFKERILSGELTKTQVAGLMGVPRVSLQMFIKYHNLLPGAIGPKGGFPNDDPAIHDAVERVLAGGNMTLIAKRLGMPLTSLSYYVQKRKRAVIKSRLSHDPNTRIAGGQTRPQEPANA